MRTLLVFSPHPEFAQSIATGVNSEQYRVIHRTNLEEAEPLLTHGLVHACIVDVELTGVQSVWTIEKLRRRDAKCPIIICTAKKQPEWEEEAYLHGVTHVVSKPVSNRMLNTLLDRMFASPVASAKAAAASQSTRLPDFPRPVEPMPAPVAQTTIQPLAILRDFSSILTHSLDSEAMLKQFLLMLREILSINRATIFLRQSYVAAGGVNTPEESRRLRAICGIGLSAGLLEHFELSLDAGIGGQLFRLGRILRRSSEEARTDVETQKEFELLGAQVAVPVLDRETLIGVAVFDGRVTGEQLVNTELELIFHLLEQVGLAVRNIWLHDQLAANSEMMAGVLRELNSACVVVSRDLTVLHANKMARKHFSAANRTTGELEFTDLPQPLSAKVYQVLRTGAAIAPFRYEPEGSPGTIYNVSVVPFQRKDASLPISALLTIEDLTQSEQLRKLEVEAANLRLVKTMADRLAHEVGNAMVPLSTHQQLLSEKYRDPEFRDSLDSALADGVKRVTRLINQMRFLARDSLTSLEAFPLTPLIQEAYDEARKHQPSKTAKLKYDNGGKPVIVSGDRAALKHALTEVMINALQANPSDAKIGVHLQTGEQAGPSDLLIEVEDNGTGFSPEAIQRAPAPFFTTRNVGLGLGLTVTRKIIETHRGRLEIVPPKAGHSGVVRISLPVENAPAAAS
jgi:signal transduction histidine kinase/DNA-binding NarL/FixJ family response regulator